MNADIDQVDDRRNNIYNWVIFWYCRWSMVFQMKIPNLAWLAAVLRIMMSEVIVFESHCFFAGRMIWKSFWSCNFVPSIIFNKGFVEINASVEIARREAIKLKGIWKIWRHYWTSEICLLHVVLLNLIIQYIFIYTFIILNIYYIFIARAL